MAGVWSFLQRMQKEFLHHLQTTVWLDTAAGGSIHKHIVILCKRARMIASQPGVAGHHDMFLVLWTSDSASNCLYVDCGG